MTENPYESPLSESELAKPTKQLDCSRLWSAMVGTSVGLFVWFVATVVLLWIGGGPLAWLPAFAAAFAFAGLIVGVTRRLPLLVGATVGAGSMVVCLFALAENPSLQSFWTQFGLIVFGVIGLMVGTLIGLIFGGVQLMGARRSQQVGPSENPNGGSTSLGPSARPREFP